MHIHLTRESDVLALYETDGKKEWNRISLDEMQSSLAALKGEEDAVVYCSADDPDQFEVDPPKKSRLIVEMILAHNLAVKFLRAPLHSIDNRPGSEKHLQRSASPSDKDARPVLRVSAFKSGAIQVDGKSAILSELDLLLSFHASRHGVVWYYREEGQVEPSGDAEAIFELIMKHKCPIRLSGSPDFSDTIDQDGNSQPKKQ